MKGFGLETNWTIEATSLLLPGSPIYSASKDYGRAGTFQTVTHTVTTPHDVHEARLLSPLVSKPWAFHQNIVLPTVDITNKSRQLHKTQLRWH